MSWDSLVQIMTVNGFIKLHPDEFIAQITTTDNGLKLYIENKYKGERDVN